MKSTAYDEVDGAGDKHIKYRNSAGEIHNEDGPAIIYPNDEYIGYMIHNNHHRLDGPARIWKEWKYWVDSGIKTQFYIDNVELSEEDYWKHPQVVAYNAIDKTALPPEDKQLAFDSLSI